MSAIKSRDTEPELILRKALFTRGYRYRIHYKKLPGKPDIVFTKAKIAVFCDGDFWHGHNWALRGLSSLEEELEGYSDFWKKKILRNVERDRVVTEQLQSENWQVIRIWESQIRSNVDQCVERIEIEYFKQLGKRQT